MEPRDRIKNFAHWVQEQNPDAAATPFVFAPAHEPMGTVVTEQDWLEAIAELDAPTDSGHGNLPFPFRLEDQS